MMIQLTEYEYMMCVLFAEASARTQQKVEFGNKQTAKRNYRDIRDDTLCGKMAEVAFARWLRENYNRHLPVNYEVYPVGEWDDEDIAVDGLTIDIKSTRTGHCLLLEENKVEFRIRQGRLPHMLVMCKTDMEQRQVTIVGCISSVRLTDPKNEKVKRLKVGDCIPGTRVQLQANNYCVEFMDLCDVRTAFDYITSQKKVC